MIWNIQPTLDLLATSTTKLLQRYGTTNIKDKQAQQIDTFSNSWTNEILLVHPQIPIFSRQISYLNKKIILAIVIAPWWLGQPWFIILMNQSNKYLIHGQSSQCLIKGLNKENQKSFLPPGKIAAFLMSQKWQKDRMFLTQIQDRIGLSRGAQQLLIDRRRFETQRHYLYAMRTLAEFSYEHGPSIDQLLSISPGFLLLEVINWFTRQNPSAFSANTLQSCLNSTHSLIFIILQTALTPSKMAYRAILN
ncbi:MAG: hypothetical protein EZS28_027580 [Streblomastix strix]|uniref:Uncharacterized protein n=1 Tax=Streblomastix strix TaxID=222440 RepID=A0A5J4V4C0_9EUKA|nr:MAG: hypothetical protein EZS28_027580 [Streblomastix strix]